MSKVYLSKKANEELQEYLISKGFTIEYVDGTGTPLTTAVKYHPDIYFCDLGTELFEGDKSKLSDNYPGDVLYNCARVGKYFICSRFADPKLIEKAKSLGLVLVEVPQGYVKCNIAIVSDSAIITEDEGIAKALESKAPDIKVLPVQKGFASLPPYKYGFIGGSSGLVKGELIFSGNLEVHPDFKKIKEFVEGENVSLKYFTDYPLEDIGSIIADPQ